MNKLVGLSFILLAAPVWTVAQGAPVPDETAAHSMQLTVVVTDKKGGPIAGLTQQDFTLQDNGKTVPITDFHAYPGAAKSQDPPVELVIVVDSLNADDQASALRRAVLTRTGVESYLKSNGGHLPLPTSVVLFNENGIQGTLQRSTDGAALDKELVQRESSTAGVGSRTSTLIEPERLRISLDALTSIVQQELQQPGRKLVLWVGPSWPLMLHYQITGPGKNANFSEMVGFYSLLEQAQITLYSVSLGQPTMESSYYQSYLKGVKNAGQMNAVDLNSRVFAIRTGGLVLGPDMDLGKQIDTCAQDANTYYTVTFSTPKADGRDEYHDLKMTVDKPGLKVRTTAGYYGEP